MFVGALAFMGAQRVDITLEEARAIAKDAYIYGFPLVDNYRIQQAYFVNCESPQFQGGETVYVVVTQ